MRFMWKLRISPNCLASVAYLIFFFMNFMHFWLFMFCLVDENVERDREKEETVLG